MKNYQIILFFVGVFGLLSLVCVVFPEDGLNVTLRFPKLEDVFSQKTETVNLDDSLQILEKDFYVTSFGNNDEVLANSDSLCFIDTLNFYKQFDTTSIVRFYFPNDNVECLQNVFYALENQNNGCVHILHYGDSQIEMDRISGYFRQALQEKFGGRGVGLLPVVPLIQSTAVSQYISDSLPRYVASGTMRQKLSHNRYGVLAQMAQLSGTVNLKYTSRDWKQVFEGTKQFSKVRLLLGNNKANFKATLKVGDKSYEKVVDEERFEMTELSWQLDNFVSSCSLQLQGTAELYGVSLESKNGVTVDNIPLRGSAGTFFTTISSSLLQKSMSVLSVPMIILEYGGNAVPAITSDNSLENYKKEFGRQIRYLQNVYPNALVLVIGPADMSTKINGELQTWPYVEKVVQAMKEVSLENGAVFWNMFEVMGGRNSMIQWVSHKPAWAAPDYIHFTAQGAKRIAEVFTESFLHYYEYYKFLQRNSQWVSNEQGNVKKSDMESVMDIDSIIVDSLELNAL